MTEEVVVRRLLLLAVVIPAIAAAGCAGSAPAPRTAVQAAAPTSSAAPAVLTSTVPVITASGHGVASGAPDLLTVSLGVQTNGPTAHGVLETNNAEAAALIAKLHGDGVAPADIQTTELSLNPVYDTDRLTGYQATDTVTVRLHQLDRAGAVIDDAVSAGGGDSQVQMVTYSVEDPSPLIAAAHADAVHQAVAEAKAMAAAAGVSLGALRAVTDASAPQVTPYVSAAAASAPAAGAVPVQAGTEQVSADVTVTYAVAS